MHYYKTLGEKPHTQHSCQSLESLLFIEFVSSEAPSSEANHERNSHIGSANAFEEVVISLITIASLNIRNCKKSRLLNLNLIKFS